MKNLFTALLLLITLMGCAPPGKSSSDSQTVKVTENAIEAPIGTFFLFRLGNRYGAVKLTKHISRGDGGFKYVWYYQSDRSGTFTNDNAYSGQNEVFENYRRTKRTEDGWEVENDGGILHINCGDFKLEWSLNTWVYFKSQLGYVEFAITGEADIQNINYLNENLVWYKTKPQAPKFSSPP